MSHTGSVQLSVCVCGWGCCISIRDISAPTVFYVREIETVLGKKTVQMGTQRKNICEESKAQ